MALAVRVSGAAGSAEVATGAAAVAVEAAATDVGSGDGMALGTKLKIRVPAMIPSSSAGTTRRVEMAKIIVSNGGIIDHQPKGLPASTILSKLSSTESLQRPMRMAIGPSNKLLCCLAELKLMQPKKMDLGCR